MSIVSSSATLAAAELHSHYMASTEKGYDEAVDVKSVGPSPLHTSLAPGTWLQELSVHGSGWAHLGDPTDEAEAIRDGWRFGAQLPCRRYVVDDRFEEVQCNEPKVVNPSSLVPSESSIEICPLSIKTVTDAELNAVYLDYENGDATTNDVLVALAGFANRLARKNASLMERGIEEDVAVDFILHIRPDIIEKKFEGRNGARFSTWARTIWEWSLADFWKDAYKHKKRFAELVLAEDEEDAGQEDHSPIDAMSREDYRQHTRDNNRAAQLQHRHVIATRTLERLDGPAKAVALSLLEGKTQEEIAAHVGLSSRYAVGRVVRNIRKVAERQAMHAGGAA